MERREPAAVLINPRPNARYLKNSPESILVGFTWNRINLESGELLHLEISDDRSFSRITWTVEGLNSSAETVLDAGLWHWRLSLSGTILSTGRFTIIDARGPALLSPAMDGLYRYQYELPAMRFQWSEIEEASHYLLDVSDSQNFNNPRIRKQTAAAFFADSSLGPGTWYWRVMPVFSSGYEGNGAYSSIGSFRIEQGDSNEFVMTTIPASLPSLPETSIPPVIEQTAPAPLSVAGNRFPPGGHRIGIEELRSRNNLVFSWTAVQGANAYIFTLYQQTTNGRRQIIRRAPENRTSFTLENLDQLDRGTFYWQVEAVNLSRNGLIERRGRITENSFVLDIPYPGPIQVEKPGLLYGF
jgi:hypothetical protein